MGEAGGRAIEVKQVFMLLPSRDPSYWGLTPRGGAWELNTAGAASGEAVVRYHDHHHPRPGYPQDRSLGK